MKNAYVPVANLSAEELEEVRAYKRETVQRFRERKRAGVVVQRDQLGIGCHKPVSELTPEELDARRAYMTDAARRWRENPENTAKHNKRTWTWHQYNKDRQAEYRKWYRAEKLTPERESEYNRKSLYGLKPEDFDVMLMTQCGKCAICGDDFGEKSPHVDHDHETGDIRGLLCARCNTGIGGLREEPINFLRALDYLAS